MLPHLLSRYAHSITLPCSILERLVDKAKYMLSELIYHTQYVNEVQMTKAFTITRIYDRLLRGSDTLPVGLYHLHLLTAAQLTRLHYSPGSYKAIRQRLNDLADNGYVVISAVPKEFTRGPNYYTLGVRGIQYLRELG